MTLERLVIFLPGIGGSVLASSADLDKVVWDAGKRDVAATAFQPSRLAADLPLTAIGLTESAKFLGFTVVPGYEGLLKTLGSLGTVDHGHPESPVPNADIIVFPYDFRGSVAHAAQRLDEVVRTRLNHLSNAEKAQRVVVVAHSLGGLVARAWMGLFGERGTERWRWCRALITLGTPHRGAPKALDWAVNGVGAGPLRLQRSSAMLRQWPSVMELLPRYPAIRDVRVKDQHNEKAALYPYELPVGLGQPAKDAYQLHLAIEQAWSETIDRGGPEMVTCLGWAHETLDAAFWDGRRLRVCKEQPDWLDRRGWTSDIGDGTVPATCAVPVEEGHKVTAPRRRPEPHIPLANTSLIRTLLAQYAEKDSLTKMRNPQEPLHPPSLGLNVDQLHAAGIPIPVTVIPREIGADLGGQPVWARLIRPDGEEVTRVRLSAMDGQFTGVLPSQPPGLLAIQVSAEDVPEAGDMEVSDFIAVLDESADD